MSEDRIALLKRMAAEARIKAAGERRLKRMKESQRQREAQVLLETPGKRVCFYPGAGLDWGPLRCLAGRCDTFVFCDWSRLADDIIVGDRFGGLQCEFLVDLDSDTVRELSDDQVPRLPWRIEGGYNIRPWGKYARLTRTTGKAKKTIHLFYFGIEGITLFFNLFTASNTGPTVICLKGNGGLARHRKHIHAWNAPLGKLVQRCQHWPTHLIVKKKPRPGWPHTKFWKRFDDWEGNPIDYVKQKKRGRKPRAQKPRGARRKAHN